MRRGLLTRPGLGRALGASSLPQWRLGRTRRVQGCQLRCVDSLLLRLTNHDAPAAATTALPSGTHRRQPCPPRLPRVGEGKALDSEVDAAVVSLVDIAINEKLAICAGAGISRGAGLPDGRELARRLHARLEGQVSGYACDQPGNLLAVAEAAASVRGGLEAVQRVVLQLAPFNTAPPQQAHRLLALLVAEGAARLLLTNWDDCVERSWRQDEHLPAARNAFEAEALRGQVILKIHGCCTEVQTMLLTAQQLENPGLWVETHFEAELAGSTMVFVGVGDIAEYAQQRITQLAQLVDNARIRVVSPDIDAGWEGSAWAALLPDLPAERRLPRTAENFFDQLAREWVMGLVRAVRVGDHETQLPQLQAVCAAFAKFTAEDALVWLRRAAVGWLVGESVVRNAAAETALEAIAVLAAEDPGAEPRFARTSSVHLGDRRIEVMLCKPRVISSAVESAAMDRARAVATRRGPVSELTVLCSAMAVRGKIRALIAADDVVDPDAAIDDQIDGPRQVAVNLIYAEDLLKAV